MEFESVSEKQSWLHVRIEHMGRFCQGGKFFVKKAVSIHFIQKKFVFQLLCGTRAKSGAVGHCVLFSWMLPRCLFRNWFAYPIHL